jgi:hypothetical protein
MLKGLLEACDSSSALSVLLFGNIEAIMVDVKHYLQ